MRLVRARRSTSGAVAAVALLCVLGSCGTSSTTSQTSPATAAPATTAAPTTAAAPTAAACEDVAELRSSLEALTKVKPAQDGVAALKTAIANVKTNLDAAEASASPVLQPSVQQVKTAFAELQTAASGLTADNFKQKAPSIASATKQVVTATQALSSALTQSCPGS
jgi:phage-related protein